MFVTIIALEDQLPLTCSRKGTCCHGNQVLLNPWEILQLAKEKNIQRNIFIQNYCEWGGVKLKFNGPENQSKKAACNLYVDNFGCSVHEGRPLACRLFPIGRQIQHQKVQYVFQGNQFPCLNGCEEVVNLPSLSVNEYLKGQLTESFETAQDEYLEIVQNLADVSISLLLDTELINSTLHTTLKDWKKIGLLSPEELNQQIEPIWKEYLLIPELTDYQCDVNLFTSLHNTSLLNKAQDIIDKCQTIEDVYVTSLLMMKLALYLAISVGANPIELANHWIEIAKENGAVE